MKYDDELLKIICERDKCNVDIEKIGEKLKRNVRIKFRCNCGLIYEKSFECLFRSGGYCKECTEKRKQEKYKKTCKIKYGFENAFQSQEVRDRYISTCLEKYNTDNVSKVPEINAKIKKKLKSNDGQKTEAQEKFRKTCLEKYGVLNPMQSKEIQKKSKETCLKKYGHEYILQSQMVKDKILDKYGVDHIFQTQDFKDKSKKTFMEKYGCENPSQSKEIREKIQNTCLRKYGVKHTSQYPVFAEKALQNSFNLKDFVFPCNNIVQVQGYEPFLLQSLVEEGFTYEDIVVSREKVPEIWYCYNGMKCRYYCDVYIPKINKIYEVKSTWTCTIEPERIFLKKQACIDAGYLFEMYVYDAKGIRQNV